jgi:hypothetical protein
MLYEVNCKKVCLKMSVERLEAEAKNLFEPLRYGNPKNKFLSNLLGKLKK